MAWTIHCLKAQNNSLFFISVRAYYGPLSNALAVNAICLLNAVQAFLLSSSFSQFFLFSVPFPSDLFKSYRQWVAGTSTWSLEQFYIHRYKRTFPIIFLSTLPLPCTYIYTYIYDADPFIGHVVNLLGDGQALVI